MTSRAFPPFSLLPVVTLFLIASLGVGCAGCGGGTVDDASAGDAAGGDATYDASRDASGDENDHGTSASVDRDGVNQMEGTGTTVEGIDVDKVPLTPAEERVETVQNLQGLRATLVAELEAVRARLKDGARTAEDRKSDTTRAAELAQGLERLDRTIKQIDEADDVTWTDVRESSLKAAGEFREWMAKYGMAS